MKFKIYLNKEAIYNRTVTCVGWINNSEVYSCGYDGQTNILRWTTATREFNQLAKIPDFIPTDSDWLIAKSSGKSNESLLISSSDGRFIILNKGVRVERSIAAHSASITACRWSLDGSSLLTAAEDGSLKIFSRAGMLRSTIIQNEGLIVCARWSPNSLSVAYCQGNAIALKPLAANSKLIKWQAHDGLVLAISWSSNSEQIASAGEDTRYKIWDTQGTNLYTSAPDDYPITSIDFSPDAMLLAVGGFNMLKLCHYTGWSYSVTRFEENPVGSLMNISWSDGAQICCASSSGNIIFGHVVEREIFYKNLKATATGRRLIEIKDIINNTTDTLDFSERIIKWELGFGHLVVATTNQLHIFNENYINTPIIIDKTEVKIIVLAKKNFVVVDNVSISIYTYNGRLHLSPPRFSGSQAQVFHLSSKAVLSLGIDVLAVRDFADQSIIHVFDLLPSASRQEDAHQIKHKQQIIEIKLNRAGSAEDQFLVFIDENHDLFLTPINSGREYNLHKIGTQVTAVMWSSECNVLVGLHDSCYSIWYCPGEACNDPSLIALTTLTYDTTEFGKNISLVNFDGLTITLCASGSNFTVATKIYCILIHKLVNENQWEKALKICRMGQSLLLWALLAALSAKRNQHEISEESYASALQIDKVEYMSFLKDLSESEKMAENALKSSSRFEEAETILLHNRKIDEAIEFCMRLHRWSRALDIAEKNTTDLERVLKEREKYLMALNKMETDKFFIKYGSE